MKVFLDTNILIDLLKCRVPFVYDARKLVIASEFMDLRLYACAQSYADAYFVLCEIADKAAVKQALLATTEYIEVCNTFGSDVAKSLKSGWNDIEDYLITHSAKHMNADYLVTRDKEVLRKSPVNTLTPRQFLTMMHDEYGLEYDEIDFDELYEGDSI